MSPMIDLTPPIEQCPHCKKNYQIGVTGTIDGCDECNGTKRDFFGQIIYEDTLTDMEKA